MDVAGLLTIINARHGARLVLRERFAGGEQGAFAVREPDGRRLVLKWNGAPTALQGYQRAAATTQRLRRQGYPAPDYVFLGSTEGIAYAVQEELPGALLGTLRAALLPRLLRLNGLQAQAASAPNLDWPGELVRSILHGCDGYCVIDSLRTYAPETRRLLGELQEFAADSANLDCPRGDIVHYDFNPFNILVDGEAVCGVIDWDGTRAGDCAFDLTTLLFYTPAPELQARLWEAAVEHSPPAAARLYLAHMMVRQVDWAIRHYDAAGIAYWLGVSLTLQHRFRVTNR